MTEKELTESSEESCREEENFGEFTEDEGDRMLGYESDDQSSLNGEDSTQTGSKSTQRQDQKGTRDQKKTTYSSKKATPQKLKIVFNVFGTHEKLSFFLISILQ